MSLTYAAAVKKNIKAKNEATKSIQTLFKAVVSVKNAPPCSKEGCKQKAKFGFNAPPIFCHVDKHEGMHEITMEEIHAANIPRVLPEAETKAQLEVPFCCV
jgi:hypothetical protein